MNAVRSLSAEQRAKGIVTMSAGNAAQAVAYAAGTVKAPVTVAMPESAPKTKVEATRGYGAEIAFAPDMTALRALVGKLQAESGAHFVHPYDDEAVIAGHGTLALEVLEDLPEADLFVVGIGGEGANAMRRALDAGKPVPLERTQTIADGLAAPIAGQRTLEIVQRLVADVVVISDDVIAEGVRFLAARARLVVEPAGAAAVGALLAGAVKPRPGERVVVVLSGGNVDAGRLAEILNG